MNRILVSCILTLLISIPIVKAQTQSSSLNIQLSQNVITGDQLIKGARAVKELSFTLTADCNDAVTVNSLTLVLDGSNDSTDIESLYASTNGKVLSQKATVDRQDLTATLKLSPPLMVNKCEKKVIDILVDISATAKNGSHLFSLELQSDIISNAEEITGAFPLGGNIFVVTNGGVQLCLQNAAKNLTLKSRKDARRTCRVEHWQFMTSPTNN